MTQMIRFLFKNRIWFPLIFPPLSLVSFPLSPNYTILMSLIFNRKSPISEVFWVNVQVYFPCYWSPIDLIREQLTISITAEVILTAHWPQTIIVHCKYNFAKCNPSYYSIDILLWLNYSFETDTKWLIKSVFRVAFNR